MLTAKQEQFCNNIVSGMSAQDSYISSYACNSRQAASVEATKLLKRDDITERITELRKPINNLAQNIAINERKEQINYIKQRIAICEQQQDEQSIIRYTDMLNKLYNLYKDTENDQKQENTVSALDTATLVKLSGTA